MRILKLDFERHATRKTGALALLALVLVPSFIALSLTWAQADATDHLERIEAAVVNNDEAVTVDGQYIPLGRVLVAELTKPGQEFNISWTLTNAETAEQGLASGRFSNVVTIPSSFSASALSFSALDADTARHAKLSFETSASSGAVDPTVGQAVATAITATLNERLIGAFAEKIFLGFTEMRKQMQEAVDGSEQVADGAQEAYEGSGKLADGAGELADGADELHRGLKKLAVGAHQVDDGAARLAAGSDELAHGADRVADGAEELNTGIQQLNDGASQIRDGVNETAAQVEELLAMLDQLNVDTEQTREVLHAMVGQVNDMENQIDQALAVCATIPEAQPVCQQVQPVREQFQAMEEQIIGVPLEDILEQVDAIIDRADSAPEDLARLVDAINQLADGAQRLADGSSQLAVGSRQVANGAAELSAGAHQLHAGTSQLAAGADQAAEGSGRLAAGARELANGAVRLHVGLGELARGSRQLADGLRLGLDKIPYFSEDDAKKLSEVVASPVTNGDHLLPDAAVAAAYFTAIALAVGALVTYLYARAVPRRAVSSPDGPVRLALQSLRPGLLISLIQAVVIGVGFGLVLGLSVTTVLAFTAIVLLAGAAFAAVIQALVAWFGGAGRIAALVVLVISTPTMVVSASPKILDAVVALTPLAPTVGGLRGVLVGTNVALAVFLLLVWLLAGIAATVFAIIRQRNVTPRALARLVPA